MLKAFLKMGLHLRITLADIMRESFNASCYIFTYKQSRRHDYYYQQSQTSIKYHKERKRCGKLERCTQKIRYR